MTTTDLSLDDLQRRWQEQDRKLEQVLRINHELWRQGALAAPRRALGWLRFGAVVNIVIGGLFLLWTGGFCFEHRADSGMLLAGLALHAWLMGAVGTEVVLLVRAAAIDYDAPVVVIQRQVAELRRFSLRALGWLFDLGVVVWTVPFMVVVCQDLLGLDLRRTLGGQTLLAITGASVLAALVTRALLRVIATRFAGSAAFQAFVASLAGSSLMAAEAELARLAEFERG